MNFLNRHRSFVVLAWFMGLIAFIWVASPPETREGFIAMAQDLLPPLLVFGFLLVGTLVVVFWAMDGHEEEDSERSQDEVVK